MVQAQLPLSSTVETVFHGEDEVTSFASRRSVRVALVLGSACALLAMVGFMAKGSSEEASGTELMWGGPLSFDMVHTHILNMKMRRSRLKEKLKQAALKRKDREIAQEHGFNAQGNMQQSAAPAPQQQMMQAPPAPQYQPMQAPQMYQQPPQMYQQPPQMMQQQPMYGAPQQQYGAPPQQYGAPAPAPQFQQMPQQPMYGEPPAPQYAPQQQPGYPPQQMMQAPPEAPQLAQMPQQMPQAPNPWGGMTVSSAPSQAVHVGGPTESSSDDKEQQRSQAAASITAYEQFMHGGAPAPAKAAPGGAQGMMMKA